MADLTPRPIQTPVMPVMIEADRDNQQYLERTRPEHRMATNLITDLRSENQYHFYASRQQIIANVIYTLCCLTILAVGIAVTAIFSPVNIPLVALGVAFLAKPWYKYIYKPFKDQAFVHKELAVEAKFLFLKAHQHCQSRNTIETLRSDSEEKLSMFYKRMGVLANDITPFLTQLTKIFQAIHSTSDDLLDPQDPKVTRGLAHTLGIFMGRESILLSAIKKANDAEKPMRMHIEGLQKQNTIIEAPSSVVSKGLKNSRETNYKLFAKKIKFAQHAIDLLDPTKRLEFSKFLPFNVNPSGQIIIKKNTESSLKTNDIILTESDLQTTIRVYLEAPAQSRLGNLIKAFIELPILMDEPKQGAEIPPLENGAGVRCFMEAVLVSYQKVLEKVEQQRAAPPTDASSPLTEIPEQQGIDFLGQLNQRQG